MSSFHDWEDLHPYTRRSVQAAADRCGCHPRENDWWLCEAHDAYEDGARSVQEHLTEALALIDTALALLLFGDRSRGGQDWSEFGRAGDEFHRKMSEEGLVGVR